MLMSTAVADQNFNNLPVAEGDDTSSESEEGQPRYHTQPQRGRGRMVGLLVAIACVTAGTIMVAHPGSPALRGDASATKALVLFSEECTVAMDTAYFYVEPVDDYIDNVATAEGCCQKCQAASYPCESWTWVKSLRRCFTKSGLPVYGLRKKGHTSGISSRTPGTTLPPTFTVPPI